MKAQPEATPRETVAALLQRSGRDALPVRTTFVQTKSPDGVSLPGPLATFVRNGDELGLDLYLLVHSAASAAPWDVRLHAAVWTRGLCHTGRRISEFPGGNPQFCA